MAMKVAATYANGAFVPDEPVELEEGARAWIAVSGGMPALDEAERAFELAFANGGLDEARVREGCRLAWEAARASVASVAQVRGWAHESARDLRRAICLLDGIDERGDFEGEPRYYHQFRAAEIFHDRANAPSGDIAPFLLEERWQFADGLRMTRELINAMADMDRGMEARA